MPTSRLEAQQRPVSLYLSPPKVEVSGRLCKDKFSSWLAKKNLHNEILLQQPNILLFTTFSRTRDRVILVPLGETQEADIVLCDFVSEPLK